MPPATVSIADLQTAASVRRVFDVAHPDKPAGDALVLQVGGTVAVLNSNENRDMEQTSDIPFKDRGLVTGLRQTIRLQKYLLGKVEMDGRFWLQANVSIVGPMTRIQPNRGPEPGTHEVRDTTLAFACRARPQLQVQPAQALKSSTWDAGTRELRLTLGHELGAVEIPLTGQ